MQLGFLQNKSCLKLSLFCMRTDDWLNFHVKFQSIHVNITNTTHQFFLFFFFYISKTYQKQKQTKNSCQTQNKCLHTCNVYKYSEKIHFLHAFDSFQPEWLLNVTWNICYMSRETCVTVQRTSEVEEVILRNMSTTSNANKIKNDPWCLFDLEGKTFLSMSRMFQCHNFVGRLFSTLLNIALSYS